MKKYLKILLVLVLTISLVVTHIPIITAENISISTNDTAITEETVAQETESDEDAYILGELKDKRSKDTKHFRMSDGSIKACVYPQNVHYLKNGIYEDIDNTLIYDEEKGVYTNKENSTRVTLPEDFTNDYVEYSTDSGFVKFKLLGSSNKKIKKFASATIETNDKTVLNKISNEKNNTPFE